ncbi:MAG TPA: hypothetical protein V6D18_19995 [Thermosynechococcaceae cyanobacterium]|jgi:hypothetical protein
MSELYYLLRSRQDGSYLVARPRPAAEAGQPAQEFLLMFREHSDALSYLNTHGAGVVDRFAVETIAATRLDDLMQRWGFTGLGMVQDPLLPNVEFLLRQ